MLYSKAFPSGPGVPIIAQPLIRQSEQGQAGKGHQVFPFLEEHFWKQPLTVGCVMEADVYYAKSPAVDRNFRGNSDRIWNNCSDLQTPMPCYKNKAWARACAAVPCSSQRGGGGPRSSVQAVELRIVEQQMYSIDAAFLKHLLTKVVDPRRKMFQTDWGVDHMWCSVAHAYGQRAKQKGSEKAAACALVLTAVAIHHNTRTIAKWDDDFRSAGRGVVRYYQQKYPYFEHWSPCKFDRLQVLGVVPKIPETSGQERKRAMQMRAATWNTCTRDFMSGHHPVTGWGVGQRHPSYTYIGCYSNSQSASNRRGGHVLDKAVLWCAGSAVQASKAFFGMEYVPLLLAAALPRAPFACCWE